jgi:hypothetical protein
MGRPTAVTGGPRAATAEAARGRRDQVRSGREHGGDRQGGDDSLADADQQMHAEHGAQDGSEGHRCRAADGVQADEQQRGRGHRDKGPDEGRHDHRGRAPRKHRGNGAEAEVADQHGGQPHRRDVRPQRGQTTVAEQKGLHDDNTGDREDPRPGADEHGRQGTAHQVTTGAGTDREVDHLHREHEGGDQAGHGSGPLVELTTGTPQAEPHDGDSDGTGGHRGGQVEKAIGCVHLVLVRYRRGKATVTRLPPCCKCVATSLPR